MSCVAYSLMLCGVVCEAYPRDTCCVHADKMASIATPSFWRRQRGAVVVSGCLFTSFLSHAVFTGEAGARRDSDEKTAKSPPIFPKSKASKAEQESRKASI